MAWVVETDISAYAERVRPWLDRDPVWNTVPATVLHTRRDGTVPTRDAWLAWFRATDGRATDGATGDVAGVALCTPPRGLLLAPLPPGAVAELAAAAPPRLPGASGPAAAVADFAGAYAARTGGTAWLHQRQRLYELPELVPPPRPPGAPRPATKADVELCARWFADFVAEAGVPAEPDPETTRRVIVQGRLLLWDVGGEPVSMVGNSPTVAGVSRIGPVWTPPEHRRHGYAAAATAEVARRLQGHGRVVLFADRANPTSTGVYARLGFRPVGDWDDWRLEY
jgi:RimJ/RimL family protein N-acetyltransferase